MGSKILNSGGINLGKPNMCYLCFRIKTVHHNIGIFAWRHWRSPLPVQLFSLGWSWHFLADEKRRKWRKARHWLRSRFVQSSNTFLHLRFWSGQKPKTRQAWKYHGLIKGQHSSLIAYRFLVPVNHGSHAVGGQFYLFCFWVVISLHNSIG